MLEKMKVAQLYNKFPVFYEPKNSVRQRFDRSKMVKTWIWFIRTHRIQTARTAEKLVIAYKTTHSHNPKNHISNDYRVHKKPPLTALLNPINPNHTFTHHSNSNVFSCVPYVICLTCPFPFLRVECFHGIV
jgi:hypothetical protein